MTTEELMQAIRKADTAYLELGLAENASVAAAKQYSDAKAAYKRAIEEAREALDTWLEQTNPVVAQALVIR